MSFAQGFAAGSAAAQRGIDMGLAMKKRREEEEYKQAVAAYNAGIEQEEAGLAAYQADMKAAVPVQQGAVAQGPITSAAGLNPMAQAGIAAPAGSDVARTITDMPTAPSGLGNQARGTSFAPPPTVTSYVDQQRALANIALKYGDTSTALNLMNQAGIEERALRREGIEADRFEQTQGLAVRAQDLADLQYRDQQAEALRVRTFEEGQRQATRDLLLMVDQGKPMSDIQQFIAGNEFLDGATAMTTVTNAFNLQEAEIEAEQNRIRNDVADMTWEELKQAHIDDENISKGEHYDIVYNDESGLYDVIVFDTTNVTGETEGGEKTYAQKRVIGSTEDFGAAVNDLRTLAYDRSTAVESLTNKAISRRSRAAEAAIKQAERELERYGMDKDFEEAQLKELSEGIRDLRKDMSFASLSQADQQARIKGVYDSLGIAPPPTIGIPDVDEKKPVPKGAGLQAIEAKKKARAEKEKGGRTITSEADEILSYKTGRGLFDSPDEELFNDGYAAATPEVRAEIDRLIQAQADRDAVIESTIGGSGAAGKYGLGSIYR